VRLARYINPPLTTVRLPAYELGESAMDMLIKIINGDEVPESHLLLETGLVIRESCGFTKFRLESQADIVAKGVAISASRELWEGR